MNGEWKSMVRWLPPILWAGVIFAYSCLSDPLFFLPESLSPLLKRKILGVSWNELLWAVSHIFAYFVLAFLLTRALAHSRQVTPKLLAWVVLVVALYGLTDEIHQVFVPGRGFQWWDVLMDAVGGVLAGSWWLVAGRKRKEEGLLL